MLHVVTEGWCRWRGQAAESQEEKHNSKGAKEEGRKVGLKTKRESE